MDTPSPSPHRSRLGRYGALALVLFVVVIGVLAIAFFARERIAANQRAWFVARLEALVPPATHDNDLFADRTFVHEPDLLGAPEPIPIYRARRDGKPVALIMTVTAPEGYGGPIDLLVAMDYSGALLGVDVLRHNETQGIGDGFVPQRSDWLRRFLGRSLRDPPPKQWTIRKDGGDFDQFTGASVTPRAILKAVRLALEYYEAHRETLFNAPADETAHPNLAR